LKTLTLYTGLENLFGVYGYALQIYCDFSGYSDMAIGIALLLGFQFSINFDSPYQAKNITDFWRRWHISLSTWLRDYVYISLGGNRKGKVRKYVNLMLTMLLGGLWHGAAFRFILWGGLHGIALTVHKLYSSLQISPPKNQTIKSASNFFSILFTFHFVCLGWIFFRALSMDAAQQMINQIVGHFNPQVFLEFVFGYRSVLFLMVLGYILHFIPAGIERKAEVWMTNIPLAGKAAVVLSIILLIIQTKSASVQPFIYFQF
jgi:alginate O-acetyltransferase complex protein AlgI